MVGDMATVTQAAEELGISRRAVLLRIKNGDMQAERVGPKAILIPRSEIARWKAIGKRKGGRPRKETTATEYRQAEAAHDDALEEARRRIHGERHAEAAEEARRRTSGDEAGPERPRE